MRRARVLAPIFVLGLLALLHARLSDARVAGPVATSVPPPLNTGFPTISGTPRHGLTLTAENGTWIGSFPISYTYSWQRCGSLGLPCATIVGATDSTYVLDAVDIGQTIRVVVTGANSAGSTSATSSQTSVVSAAIPPANTAPPTISGEAVQGQTLTASTGGWSGSPDPTFSYQWRSCDSAGANCANVSGATAETYSPAAADLGRTIRVNLTATNVGGSASSSSDYTATVTGAPSNTVRPAISGTPQKGQTLTGSGGTWTGYPAPGFQYSWRRCDSVGGNCVHIPGASAATHVLVTEDVGRTIRFEVAATNSLGSAIATSTPTATIIAAPRVTGIRIDDLFAGVVASATMNVFDAETTTCQWQINDAGANAPGGAWTDIAGATGCSGYTAPSSDNARWHRLAVTASNSVGSVTVHSRAYRLGGEVLGNGGCGNLLKAFANGARVTIPTPSPGCTTTPDASPDGRLIVYGLSTPDNGGGDLWLTSSRGDTARQLTAGSANDQRPRFSPDGQKIAFLSTTSASTSIVYIDLFTGEETVLAASTPASTAPIRAGAGPEWDTDSQSVFFSKRNVDGDDSKPWKYWWRDNGTAGRSSDASLSCPYAASAYQCDFVSEIWSVNLSGAQSKQTDTPPPATASYSDFQNLLYYKSSLRSPRLSPDGNTLIYSNYGNGKAIVYSNGSETWTTKEAGNFVWRADGAKIFFSGSQQGVYVMNPDLSSESPYSTGTTFGAYDFAFLDPAGHGPLPPYEAGDLLDQYAPELRYDSQENYRADSAAEITDNVQPAYANELMGGLPPSTDLIASADHDDSADDLALDYLKSGEYPGGRAVSEEDHINEANSHLTDFDRLHEDAQYANKTYGRARFYADGEIVLQYWFFYYYNPKTFYLVGEHEGDWEMIQIRLDSSRTPIEATYSQHGHGGSCSWGDVTKNGSDGPVVYVAEGSHANYFVSGMHPLGGGTEDSANGLVAPLVPDVIDITGITEPEWMSWPGRWGGSDPSPTGPGVKGEQWSDPRAWGSATSGECLPPLFQIDGSRAAKRNRPAPPPLPSINATIVGTRIIVKYRFKTFPLALARRPWQLLVSTVSSERGRPPLTTHTLIKGRSGKVIQPLGRGRGPHHLLVSVRSRLGTRSRVISIPLRRP